MCIRDSIFTLVLKARKNTIINAIIPPKICNKCKPAMMNRKDSLGLPSTLIFSAYKALKPIYCKTANAQPNNIVVIIKALNLGICLFLNDLTDIIIVILLSNITAVDTQNRTGRWYVTQLPCALRTM